MKPISVAEYRALVREKAPKSPLALDMLRAFWVGGVICCIGQGLIIGYAALGLGQEEAGAAASITLVFLGTLLTALGLYGRIAKYAGAGTLVPITGFANAVASPAVEYKSEGFVTGMAAKMFVIAGPVIVFGLAASAVYGLVLVLLG